MKNAQHYELKRARENQYIAQCKANRERYPDIYALKKSLETVFACEVRVIQLEVLEGESHA